MSEQESSNQYQRILELVNNSEQSFPWKPEELQSVWEHTLASALSSVVAVVDPVEALRAAQIAQALSPPVASVGQLLHAARPSKELLVILADVAQGHLGNPEPIIPHAIALALYNLALIALRAQSMEALFAISDPELSQRVQWLESLKWLDEGTRAAVRIQGQCLAPGTDG